ncbi:acetylcholine receptor subunit delta-like [Ylistrum balloti]|uniref:acetylcholine receptor subunit delta-like n=1 Tax=Ylistrum balloti TaxID=509963 RepID=UPI0029059AC3|nr:acetylcholine receptor subunit delta-like [Ylistrum balloti]
MIWLPAVTILNSNDDRNAIVKSISGAQILPDGTVNWCPDVSMATSCPISVRKYPFDKQECDISLISWLRGPTEQIFSSVRDDIAVVSKELNTEWEFLGSSTSVSTIPPSYNSRVSFNIEIKRRPFYQIVHTLIPLVLLSYMNCFIFVIPINSGENTSFGVAIFLAFAVFIGPVKESLPVTSTETCLLTVYLIVQFCIGGLELCVSNITLRLAARTKHVSEKSWWMKLEKILFLTQKQNRKIYPDPVIIVEELSKGDNEGDIAKNIKTDERPCENVDFDWMALGSKLNMICFLFFIVIKSLILITYLTETF